jgi:hypothetical protein
MKPRFSLAGQRPAGKDHASLGGHLVMKRSRRVVLTMMGNAAAGAVSVGWVGAPDCGRNGVLVQGIDGRRPYCRPATYGGFGGTLYVVHGHGHGGTVHAGGG